MGRITFHGLREELLVGMGLFILNFPVMLAISDMSGILLWGMSLGYLVAIATKLIPEVEILRQDRRSRDVPVIILLVIGTFVSWVFLSSLLFSAFLPGSVFSIFSPEFFSAVAGSTNVPVLANNAYAQFIVWGLDFPIVESLFFLSAVLMFWNMLVFRSRRLPERINSKNIFKVLWVSLLVGITASITHWQARLLQDVALVADTVFFSISSVLVYFRKQILEAWGVHSIINPIVMFFRLFR